MKFRCSLKWTSLAASGLILAYGSLSASGQIRPKKFRDKIEFNRDIRPILANKCLTCHGNDKNAVQAGLHLDKREGAIATLEDGNRAIVPGHPEQSALIARINAKEEYLRMPPVDSHKTLSDEEKGLLHQWIEEGAEYKQHWAFVKPVRPPLPKVKNAKWPKNGIDYFILSELEKHGLQPSPEADKATLLRRVTLDLTGLAPTPQELAAFQKDTSPNAYEKVVDRLLASKRYGERMAMDWVDYARYADSNGYQADFERFQWRWRDWVIEAYNKNMPFDQFTVDQLAGDLLPNPTLAQKIATGFNRNHRINTEGGVIAEEWRVENVIDRVETTSTTWLGLTAGCARCHDHKYDPITQKEFYSLFAYFNNVPESGTGDERPVNHPPYIKAPYPDQAKQQELLSKEMKDLQGKVALLASANEEKANAWKLEGKAPPASLKNGIVARYLFSPEPKTVQGDGAAPKIVGKPKFDNGRSSGAVQTYDDNFLDLGKTGDFDSKQAFSYALWINPNANFGSPISKMDIGRNYRGWDLFINDGKPAVHLIDSWPQNALKVISKTMIPVGKWTHIAVTYDGSAKPEGLKIYVNGEKTQTDVEANALTGSIRTEATLKVGRRTNGDFYNGKVDDLAIYAKALTQEEIQALSGVSPAKTILETPREQRTKEQQATLVRLWSREHDPKYRELDTRLEQATKEFTELDRAIPTVMVMEEMAKPRDAYVLERGLYDKHGPKVTAEIPGVFGALPKGAPNNRLGLAEWIVSPENPLTARVQMNRFWERLFGTGIVSTSEDFGTRADFPSHPELLDWLATEFIKKGWDQKAMLKELVMSATYRQSSKVTPKIMAVDPTNKLLARGPRFRLPAEVIRDQALQVAGLLVEKIGGPSVRPYEPEGFWDETNFYGNLRNYKHDMGDGLYRRSLYTIWKRTAAPPNMTLFDVPSRETCRVRRPRTNTPLQALTLLNDETYVEAARVLAQHALEKGGKTPEERIAYIYGQVLGRKPRPDEMKILKTGLAKRITHFKANPEAAKKLVMVGDAPQNPKLDKVTLAAYVVTASTVLNLDEAITKE